MNTFQFSIATYLLSTACGLVGEHRATGGEAPTPPDKGLIAYYTFDDDARGTVYDQSGHGNHGSAEGVLYRDNGIHGRAADFSGSTDSGGRIVVPDGESFATLQRTHQLTVAVWVHPRSVPPEFNTIVSKGGNQRPEAFGGFELMVVGDTAPNFLSVGGSLLTNTQDRGVAATRRINRWAHIAYTVDTRQRTTAFYINGRKSRNDFVSWGSDVQLSVANSLCIGGPDPHAHANRSWFDGSMDELRIYNRRLAAADIRELYVDGLAAAGLHFDAQLGTLPSEQGFRLFDNSRDNPRPRIEDSALKLGPTQRKAYQFWYSKDVPITFDAAHKGVAVEWTVQVTSSEFIRRGRSELAGFNVYLTDANHRSFNVFLAEDRVIVRNDWDIRGPENVVSTPFTTTDRFHTYRFVVDDGVGMLFIDGNVEPILHLQVGKPIKRAPPNEVTFGDWSIYAGSTVALRSFFVAGDASARPEGAGAEGSQSPGQQRSSVSVDESTIPRRGPAGR